MDKKPKKVASSTAPEKQSPKRRSREKVEKAEASVDVKTKKIPFKDLEGSFLLVRVGTESHPASPADITDISQTLTELIEGNGVNCIAYVTHHAVDMKIIR